MSLGENIQKYRKDLGLSQEELGQKLLVSRQTISLWEKDQTVPTIDNLIRLKEVFDVSVDEILGFENEIQSEETKPNEAYKFNYPVDELKQINRLEAISIYKGYVAIALILVLLLILFGALSAPSFMIGLVVGIVFFISVFSVKGIHDYKKAWKTGSERISETTYEYQIYEDHIMIRLYLKGEKIRESKCYFTDIERIQQLDKWLFFQFGGQLFIVRKSDLKENSAFYSYMYNNPLKTVETPIPNKWKIISVILFVASLLSIFVALALVNIVSVANGLFIENLWLFFLAAVIPVASTIFGFILKSKGYKYKKNVIAGIIMTIILCLYGSFVFMF